MRNFQALVRAHVAPLTLAPGREQKIVEEWAAQLEEIYDALRADGCSDDEAWSDIERQVRQENLLSDRWLADDLDVAWLPHPPRRTAARGVMRRVGPRLREALATGLARDLRGSVRMLVKNPGFSATVVLTLDVSGGRVTAVYIVTNPDKLHGL